ERFAARDFIALDPLRRLLWQRIDVDWWYAQNLLLFVHQNRLSEYARAAGELSAGSHAQAALPLVHPANYLQHQWRSRVLQAAVDLATFVPPNEQLILADEDRFGDFYLPDRCMLPFLERDGAY